LKQLQLWDRRNSIARALSGGMKRRLMIARALMHEPKLLILDEPTAGVDIEIRRSMWEFLREINAQGTTIILTTHYLEEAENLCRNIAIIDGGRIAERDRMSSLLRRLHTETFVLNLREALAEAPLLEGYGVQLADSHTLEVEVSKEQTLNDIFLRLSELGIEVLSHVIAVGSARLGTPVTWEAIQGAAAKEEVLLSCIDPESEARMKEQVDLALRTGDSVGGIFEVVAHNVPPGLGTYANWDERLDTHLAAAVMSLQAVKGVEIGDAVEAARSLGSTVHDEIGYSSGSSFAGFTRGSNHAGGLEGGVSNGEDIRIRGYLKPISTLRRPLGSVDFASREPVKAAYERSDVCVVPAAGVAAEAMVALTLARFVLEKFGGDSIMELKRNFEGYCQQIRHF